MDSTKPGPLSRCTSMAAAMIVPVRPSALEKSGCIPLSVSSVSPCKNKILQKEQVQLRAADGAGGGEGADEVEGLGVFALAARGAAAAGR